MTALPGKHGNPNDWQTEGVHRGLFHVPSTAPSGEQRQRASRSPGVVQADAAAPSRRDVPTVKFTLVQPPLIKDLDEALNPPLGLLSIGAVLREQDVDVEIVDFNLRGFQDPAFLDPERFYDSAADLLASTGADAFGFTSMALESHVCLELARRLKERDPSALTIFGGPHFSAIATDAMERYPWLDYVVAGEAEKPLVDLLAHHRGRLPRHELANVAHRTGGRVVFDRRYQTSFPLDDLPLPAHDLVNVDEYFAVNPHRMLCLEHARGCQLRCAFCYSEAHWGHGEQIKSEGRILAELQALADLRAGHVFLVADNFLTSKDRAIRLCRLIEEAAFPFTWKCYATLAQLTPQVIEALSSAGCRSVFVGVDAASERTKRQFKKTYFKGWNTLRATLERCIENDVYPTCSFMLCSEDSAEGLEQTLQTALFAKAIGAHVCINALSRYNRTGLDQGESASSIRYSDKKPRLLFHTPAVNETNLYAQDAPQLYPMHQGSLPLSSDHDLFEFTCIAEILTDHYTSVMVRALFDADIDVSDVIHGIHHLFFGGASHVLGDTCTAVPHCPIAQGCR